MKRCPSCGKTYDDSWKNCMNCDKPLVFAEGGISNEEYSRFERGINERFQKLEARLEKIEAASGIVTDKTEAPKYIKLKETAVLPASGARPAPAGKPAQKQDLESTIGLVWLNRIGVVALLLGATFFLKYAFDNHWIGETARVLMGLAAGLGLITGSEIARKKKYDTMSQGLHGAGVGILYLSVYAAFGFYHLIPALAAFAFLTVITLYCGFWSVKADWRSSAIIGIAGGFLTPFLIGTGNASTVLLLAYIALLDLGVLYISFYRGWRVLNVLSLLLTHLVFAAAPGRWNDGQWMTMLSFATAYFAIFSVFPITRNLVRREKSDGLDALLVLLNGVLFFGHVYELLGPHVKSAPGVMPLMLSALYVGYAYSALRRVKEDKALILTYVGLAVLFVTVAVPIQLKQNWVTISWAVEAALLCWIGFRIESPSARRISVLIGALALFRLFFIDFSFYDTHSLFVSFWNQRTLTYLICAACSVSMGRLYRKYDASLSSGEKWFSSAFFLLANGLFLYLLCLEAKALFYHLENAQKTVHRTFFSERELTISTVCILYALADLAAGMKFKYRPLRLMALVIFGMAILKIFFIDLSQLDRLYRIISFIGLGVVLMVASFFYQKHKDRIAGLL